MTLDKSATTAGGDAYFQILDTAPDAMLVVARDETMVFVNAQTENIFGYPRAELLGRPLTVLIPERFRRGHRGHVERYTASPATRPMGSGLELRGTRRDGTEFPVEVSLSPVRIAGEMFISAAVRDITERKRIEAAASVNAERLASAVESMQSAFVLFDAQDKLVLCNSDYRSLLAHCTRGPLAGRSRRDLLEQWLSELVFADESERARFIAERVSQVGEGAFDVQTRDGRSLRVIDRLTLEGGIVETIWDLTEDVRQAAELRETRAEAEAGSAAKSDFLSSMSHELRTPLNAVLGFAQLLKRDKRDPLSARHQERVQQILAGGEHLLRLIDDVLDLAKIEAGGVAISTEPVSVPDVLETVVSAIEPMAGDRGVRIEVLPIPSDLPMLAVDRTRFVQILMNFGSNAIKYNRPRGSARFSVTRVPQAEVPPHEETASFLRVSVADTGIGIAQEKQHKLFQPFQRAGQETGPIEGTGIGLLITKRLAALMNGHVGFRSREGEGSEFWVDLPVHASSARAERVVTRSRLGRRTLGDNKRVVLYVEDNPANVAFMDDLLSGFDNIELISANSAEEGLDLARMARPCIIIMDINLPGMSGLEALRALRQLPETMPIPVIALTAAASERDRQRGELAGFFRYLTKPLRVDELEAALEAVFDALPAR